MLFVTGGAGFIGSNFVLSTMAETGEAVLNLDKLTYAGNLKNLAPLEGDARHTFVQGDICDRALVRRLLAEQRPRAIVHFAAESHVDRSIDGPAEFVQTNVTGTFSLLEEARAHWSALPAAEKASFRFLHVSTDEVYGSLGADDPAFSEQTPYAPNSPYAASKAASDHLVRAYHHTYGLPTLTTNCSNNYGPYQFPEKLIPLVIHNALARQAVAGVRRRQERARLALRARPLRGGAPGARQGPPGRDLQYRRQQRADQHRCRATNLCSARSSAQPRAGRGSYADLIDVREGSARPRPPLRDRQPQDPRRARLVAAGELRVRT